MIYFQLFWEFVKVGVFCVGGGYASMPLIQAGIVDTHHWLTMAEFVDVFTISQMTPGPIGINAATYTGYTAVVNAGYPEWAAVIGAILASLSIIWLPFILMICISRYLIKHKDSKFINDIFGTLRPAIVGLLLAAALMLMSKENFGDPTESVFVFIVSIFIFIFSFLGTRLYKIHPIIMIILCGLAGLLIY